MSMSWIHSHPGASALLRGGVLIDRELSSFSSFHCPIELSKGRVGVCKNVEPTGSGTSSDNGKGGELDTAEPEEIAQDECLGNKAEKGVVKRSQKADQRLPIHSTDSDYSTLDASSAAQYVLLFGESVPYLARTLSD
ncbi:hypothetical protein VNO80_33902 [Phaseolus coccineus]|uniref:Uncharacterized protein n=1 Tax=Phaseolus coccineus TaxID=3886 RepID=A0AAN9L1G9_PHACN